MSVAPTRDISRLREFAPRGPTAKAPSGNRPIVASQPTELVVGDTYIKIGALIAHADVHLKLEGFSVGGSIKMKTARYMVGQLEDSGRSEPGMRIIESSSGNLGIALSIIAAERGYRFTCVSDPNISSQALKLMRAYGAEVVIIDRRDGNGGYLGSRIAYIKSRLASEPGLIWLNQYANSANPLAHECCTGAEILASFARPDFVFVGAGTTGTLTGVSRAIRPKSPSTQIVAVDSVGSVTFGTPPGARFIPGLGASRRPEIATEKSMDALQPVPEADTIVMCRRLAAHGLLVGGSTGTVLAAVSAWSARIPRGSCVVAISPDLGDRYLDSVYDDEWVEQRFPGLLRRYREQAATDPLYWAR